MSNNASKYTPASVRLSAAAADAASEGFDLSNQNACLQQAREATRPWMTREEREVAGFSATSTFNKEGCEALVASAAKLFSQETGVDLPYNTSVWGSWVGESRYNKLLTEERQEMLKEAARFAGWLKEAVKCPVLVKLIDRTTTANGMNSPYTTMNMYRLFERFQSPWAAQRKLCAIQERANQILEPFGFSASWEALGNVLTGKYARRTGRAARAAAEMTVEEFFCRHFSEILSLIQARGLKVFLREYSKAQQSWAVARVIAGEFDCLRDALAHAERRLIVDKTDGVDLLLDWMSTETIHRVEVTSGWLEDGELNKLCRQVHTNHTYHASGWYSSDNKKAVKTAIREWRKRVALEVQQADFIGFLNGETGFCPLVFLQDSYESGNCQSGTASWVRERGWQGRAWIPASWLIPHLDYGLVRNVAMKVYQDFQGELAIAA